MSGVIVEHLQAGYAPAAPVLRDVHFEAPLGGSVGVLGPNGGGKTTLFRVLLGELTPLQGRVALGGSVASVPQGDHARLDFPVSALDVTLMGAYGRTPWWRRLTKHDHEAAAQALERVGLTDRARDRYGTLSGGQRRRVLIARALVQDAQVLVLDEPFAGVDRTSEERILHVLDELVAEGRTLLVATHDVEQARRWDRVLCLNGRQIAYGSPADVLVPGTLQQTYGGELIVVEGVAAGAGSGTTGSATIIAAPHHDCGGHDHG
jgi:manganese/iron transport system ATP-binding protein/manganese/zinc/iron transport system ATP- binding protein